MKYYVEKNGLETNVYDITDIGNANDYGINSKKIKRVSKYEVSQMLADETSKGKKCNFYTPDDLDYSSSLKLKLGDNINKLKKIDKKIEEILEEYKCMLEEEREDAIKEHEDENFISNTILKIIIDYAQKKKKTTITISSVELFSKAVGNIFNFVGLLKSLRNNGIYIYFKEDGLWTGIYLHDLDIGALAEIAINKKQDIEDVSKKHMYRIDPDLFAIKIEKVTKNPEKYAGIIEMNKMELDSKIEEYLDKGLKVEMYHQEEFADGVKFIIDETYNPLLRKKLTQNELNEFLDNYAIKTKEAISKYLQDETTEIPTGKYIYNVLLRYANENKINIIYLESFHTLISCIGSKYNTMKVINDLKKKNIYLFFLKENLYSGISENIGSLDYMCENVFDEIYYKLLLKKEKNINLEKYEKLMW